MVTLTKNGFESSYDLSSMLFEDMEWLSKQVSKPKEEFVKIATEIELDQENWNRFWKRVRDYRTQLKDIECLIGDKTYMFTEEEFEVAKQILNCPNPEEISDCCSAGVYPHNDHTSRCEDCKEGCGVVYIF